MRDVVTIGSTTLDSFWSTSFDVVDWDAPSGKALAVPFGEKFGTEDVHFALGGNAANAAVTFARQGLDAGLFTKIGKDVRGRQVLEWLAQEGIDTSCVEYSGDKGTPESVLLLQGGERSIITYHGAINDFSFDDVDLEKLMAKWWYVSLPGDSYTLFDDLLEYAGTHGIKVALNPSYKHLSGNGREHLLSQLKHVSFLVLNRGEAADLTGTPFEQEKEAFKTLDDLVPGIVAITAGKEGVVVSDGARIYRAGIFQENEVKDRTGAGDSFGSGFVAGLARRGEECKKGVCNLKNIEYAIRLACANATSVVEHIGATEGVLRKKDFDEDSRWRELKIFVEEI